MHLSADAQTDYYRLSPEEFWHLDSVNQIIDPNNFNRPLLEAALFHASNDIRKKKGKASLSYNPILHKAARHQSELMAQAQKLSHQWRSPRESSDLPKRVALFSGSFNNLGENVARIYLFDIAEDEAYFIKGDRAFYSEGLEVKNKTYRKLAQECIAAWMNSKGHRRNLLAPFQELGTGASFWVNNKKGLNFDIYLSQNFGTP